MTAQNPTFLSLLRNPAGALVLRYDRWDEDGVSTQAVTLSRDEAVKLARRILQWHEEEETS